MSNTRTLSAFLAGAATGAIAALLFAHARGKDSMQYIFGSGENEAPPIENSGVSGKENSRPVAPGSKYDDAERW